MRYSNKIFIELGDDDLDCLNQYKNISKIFKEKQIKPIIKNLNSLLKIKKILPDDFYFIDFRYYNYFSKEKWKYSISDIMDNIDLINLKFWWIHQSFLLSPDEFQFWWKMLRFRKTRFNITTIDLKFSLLSKCLTVLSLCSGCPELRYVNLKYSKADAENEHEAVEQAKREFRQKFGFIHKLYILKFKEQ